MIAFTMPDHERVECPPPDTVMRITLGDSRGKPIYALIAVTVVGCFGTAAEAEAGFWRHQRSIDLVSDAR